MNSVESILVAPSIDGEIRFVLKAQSICRIGRSEQSTIRINDILASREHAIVRSDADGHCYVSDLGSRNGTTVNGRPVASAMVLHDGDCIGIGTHELRFEQVRAGQAAAAPSENAHAKTQMFLANMLITVLVIDIRDYTRLSRELGEQRISEMVSHIFRFAGNLLNEHRCWSQKYIGDAVMAVWQHPVSQIDIAELAGIIDVLGELVIMFEGLQAEFGVSKPVMFGAAINSGYAALGNMGSASVADFTALGDTVNKTFRLESATKQVGFDVLIGQNTMKYLFPAPAPELLPPMIDVEIKGYDALEPTYRLTFGDLPRFVRLIEGVTAVSHRPFPARRVTADSPDMR